MPSREPEPLFGTSHFRVVIGDRELGFAEVSRLTSVGEESHRFDTVVLRRALTGSTELYDWRRRIFEGKDDRRDVTIQQLDAPAGRIVNSWQLTRAWPYRWSGPSFNALGNALACEELELAFDDLVWLEQNTTTKGD
jgi:phage tail-like protein